MVCLRSVTKPRIGSGMVFSTESLHPVAFTIISCRHKEIIISHVLWCEQLISPNFLSWTTTTTKKFLHRISLETSAEILVLKLPSLCQCSSVYLVSIMFSKSLAQIRAGKEFCTLAVNKWLRKAVNLCRRGCLQPTIDATACNQHADGMRMNWKGSRLTQHFCS